MSVHPEKLKAGFKAAHALLGSHPQDGEIQTALDAVLQAGLQETRVYHRAEHFEEVAGSGTPQTLMDAIRFRAGLYHDVVYQHVDAHGEHRSGFAPDVANTLGLLIGRGMDGSIHMNASQDPLHQAMLNVFDVRPGEGLNPKRGQNEILSAFFGAEEGRQLGVADKYLLAEAVHIQGTVPFGPANHFETLKSRLEQANQLLPDGERLTQGEINATMESAVDMANRDVMGFKNPFPAFIENTRELLAEEAPGGAGELDDPSVLWVPLTKQSRFFTDVVAPKSLTGEMRVYHAIGNTPPPQELEQMEAAARENIRGLGDYLNANAAAVAIASAMEARNGNGIAISLNALFDAQDFHVTHAQQQTHQPDVHSGALEACQNDVMMSDRFAAQLLSRVGSDGVKSLRERAEASGMFNTDIAPAQREAMAQGFLKEAEQTLGALGLGLKQEPIKKKEPEVSKATASQDDSMRNILDTLRSALKPNEIAAIENAGTTPVVKNSSRSR